MTRGEEIALIEGFLATRCITRGPTTYVAPTSTDFSAAEETRGLNSVQVPEKATKRKISWAYMGLF